MSKEVEEAMERLERAQNDICYATLYSQEEQDKDIETVLNYIKELKKRNVFDLILDDTPKRKIKKRILKISPLFYIKIFLKTSFYTL